MILLHVYCPDPKLKDRQAATWDFFRRHEEELKHRGWDIRHVATPNDGGEGVSGTYERAILDLWGKDDLLILEQDLVPTVEIIERLAACEHPLCAQAAMLHFATPNVPSASTPDHLMSLLPQDVQATIREAGGEDMLWAQYTAAKERAKTLVGPHEAIAHRVVLDYPATRWLNEGEEWADLFGLPLTKFSLKLQKEHPPNWPRGSWHMMDHRISEYLWRRGMRCHIHYPIIPHLHPA